jgi:hypothetical protein
MVALTFAVTVRMFTERMRQIRGERIPFREIPSGSQMATRFADTRAADNYRVKHRFYAFLASSVVLWALWAVLAIALLA